MPNNTDTEAIVRGYLAAAEIGDLEAIWGFYADDITYEDTSVHQVYHGLAATKDFYVKTMGGLDVHWEVDEVYATDEGFGIGGFMAGKHIHDLPGMPATNKSFKVACASIASVRDGKIVRNRDFWSNADLLQQLGFLKPSR